MVVLRPFFTKKHQDKAPRMRPILAAADLRKASNKVVPRLRAEMEAADLLLSASEVLDNLEMAIQTAKEGDGDDPQDLDTAEALLLDAKGIRDQAKAVQEALATGRYRSGQDQIHSDVRDLSTRYNVAKKTIERLQKPAPVAAPSSSSSAPSRVVVDEGPRGLQVSQYISDIFSGEGQSARRDFALWKAEWREAENVLRSKAATGADYYNRLQPALGGKALALAQEYRDRADPYKEAMARLSREYGDDVELALEYLKPLQDPLKAVSAAEKSWERFSAMATPLKKKGLELQDLLFHHAAMSMIPPALGAAKRWKEWLDLQRRSFSTIRAADSDGKKKGKPDHNTYLHKSSGVSQAFQSTAAAVVQKTEDAPGPLVTPENLKENPSTYHANHYPTYLSEFRRSNYFKEEEVTRFFREWREDLQGGEGQGQGDLATAPGFAVPSSSKVANCLKCGDDADHRTDACQKVATMSHQDWKRLAGDMCQKCGSTPLVRTKGARTSAESVESGT